MATQGRTLMVKNTATNMVIMAKNSKSLPKKKCIILKSQRHPHLSKRMMM